MVTELYLGPEKGPPSPRTRGPLGKRGRSHSPEGTRIPKVWFLGGAGALVLPRPLAQLTQVGVRFSINAGNTAGREEFSHSC